MTVKGVVDGRAELGLVRLEEQIAAAITWGTSEQVYSSAVREASSLGLQILCIASKLACHKGRRCASEVYTAASS